ncbi:ABC transporter substrate-binding protein [Jannaschia sp. Os4]|uniref:extracellular solute-binding protein n=1 Tax=Jannaschia sp. Os4 TaxID=2807617 RepID=UPI00193A2B2A|nr:extracellular solute-binding protein [Jannaschia sp. Os4]MBM2574872.1 ABC transporter substrate-binding protein [Jannaschia sp. Os4]
MKLWITTAAVALAAHAAYGESHETVIETHAYVNFGEPVYGPDAERLAYVNPDAPKGGEISFWSQSTFDSFNGYTRKGVEETNVRSVIPESILASTADDPYAAYCYLCTTMEYPEDRAWVIFNLREDVTWSDGVPLTAEDVAFSHEMTLEQGLPEFVSVVENFVSEVEVLGPHRVKFTFNEDAPLRDRVGFAGGSVFAKHDFVAEDGTELRRLDETQDTPFLGTGPYVLGEVDMGRSVTYVRDEDWWGADHWMNVGRWNFDSVRVEVFADAAAALEGFKGGVYTFRNENSSKEWATSYDFPAVERGWVEKVELPNGAIGQAQGFVFNLRDEKWRDARVRDAVAMMLNFEWANETLFYGIYQRPESFWQNTDLQAAGLPSAEEAALLQPLIDEGLLDASILEEEARAPFANDAAQNAPGRRMLRAASRLLDEAGWETGDDGLRRKDGQTLEAVFLQTSPAFDRIVNPYVENLRRIGVDARLERVDVSQYIERRRAGDWDLVNHSPTQGYEPTVTGLKQWFHSDTAEDSSRNLMALTDPAIDRLVETFADAESLEEVTVRANALDRVLRAYGFWIPQWYKDVHTVAYWDIFDHPEDLPPLALGALDFWWYDAEAHERLRSEGAPI